MWSPLRSLLSLLSPRFLAAVYLALGDGQDFLAQRKESFMRCLAVAWRRLLHGAFFLPRRKCGSAALVRATFHHVRADERLVGESLADDGRSGDSEPLHVCQLAIVEAERLLIEVTKQMERFNGDVRSTDSSLQERPEV